MDSRPSKQRMSVVLPVPLAPIKPMVSPLSNSKATFVNNVSIPKALCKPSTRNIPIHPPQTTCKAVLILITLYSATLRPASSEEMPCFITLTSR